MPPSTAYTDADLAALIYDWPNGFTLLRQDEELHSFYRQRLEETAREKAIESDRWKQAAKATSMECKLNGHMLEHFELTQVDELRRETTVTDGVRCTRCEYKQRGSIRTSMRPPRF